MPSRFSPQSLLLDENLDPLLTSTFSKAGFDAYHQSQLDAKPEQKQDFKWLGLLNGELTDNAIKYLGTDCIITGDTQFHTELRVPLPLPVIQIKKYGKSDLERQQYIISKFIIPEIEKGLEIGVYRANLEGIRQIYDSHRRRVL